MSKNKEGIDVKCQHCGYEWKTQSQMFMVPCPRCMYRVRIKENIKKFENNKEKEVTT